MPTRTVIVAHFAAFMLVACASMPARAQSGAAPTQGTTPFALDGNRMYAQLDFVRPDGSVHRALAYVDMGSQDVSVWDSLARDVQLDTTSSTSSLRFRVGGLTVAFPANAIHLGHNRPPWSALGGLRVEASLPAAILQRYQVVMDYERRTLTLAQPGTMAGRGIAVPFVINERTGLIAVEATIDGTTSRITVDNGSAYTWVRESIGKEWVDSHADWVRGVGAVGPANMMMLGDSSETSGTLLRVPTIAIGPLTLHGIGVLATGPNHIIPRRDLFDWYTDKNAVPVIGWIGGNVLKAFRLTIDYPNRVMYWERQTADSAALSQVGLVLAANRASGTCVVAGVATKDGRSSVPDVAVGDTLLQVDGLRAQNVSLGAIFSAMGGAPGDTHVLHLRRNGKDLTVRARVTSF